MLTVEADAQRVFDSLKAGTVGYPVKKVSPDRILSAVAEVHQGGSPMSSHVARLVVTTFRQSASSTGSDVRLSPREEEILRLLARGHRSKKIADQLGIGTGTVNTHVRSIYEKLHVRSRAAAVARSLRAFRMVVALGFDRLCAMLCNTPSIRDVIAFPKTAKGVDLMTDTPMPVSKIQLRDLYIDVKVKQPE